MAGPKAKADKSSTAHNLFFKEDVKEWTCEEVSSFIAGLGEGRVWAMYARKCAMQNISGASIDGASVEDLAALGFSRIHANRIFCVLSKPERRKLVTSNRIRKSNTRREIDLCTQGEKSQLSIFDRYCASLNRVERRFEDARSKLDSQIEWEQSRTREEFERLCKIVEDERIRCMSEINRRYSHGIGTLFNELKVLRKRKGKILDQKMRMQELMACRQESASEKKSHEIGSLAAEEVSRNLTDTKGDNSPPDSTDLLRRTVRFPNLKVKFSPEVVETLLESASLATVSAYDTEMCKKTYEMELKPQERRINIENLGDKRTTHEFVASLPNLRRLVEDESRSIL
mmetsp:Transcript_14753/g.22369  ORF Transcript_14753/g.22369 Transcript_14753/m.22369 type:complete len:343 (-) Transcript_14753:87-1115(-)|eukprot:CAMPEP_0167747186 /NCGR_PEP_ID=MMETSP0110_2-20121227/4142_1 /TAXON_ID=629695 /ORGANISM="Gymnochlora sp., Strain CCMP2014" /LENGTH=342 /DNA_ID=CAMNT_0007632061 /DNA_START=156 /DNA_END=1184 /DNA_ORIENTATION=-